MKRVITLILFLASMVGLAAAAAAGEVGKTGSVYTNGCEGILAGTTPPPGTYLRWYNAYFASSTLRDSNGNNLPVGLQTGVFATVPRVIYVPAQKILGADATLSVLIPITHIDIKNASSSYNNHSGHFGDIDATTVLTWRRKHYDIVGGMDWIFPTGASDGTTLTKPGNHEYTIMPDLGAAFYFGKQRKWNASALARYEHHFKKLDSSVHMGDDFHFEWGVGRDLGKGIMVGPVGYAQWKVGDDTGSAVTWNGHVHDRVFAIGPEVRFPLAFLKSSLELRGEMEFNARARTEQNGIVATLTKRF